MKFLRTVSTRRLLALIAGVVIAAAGGTAIAVAAGGTGPVPPREGLATAIHQGLSAPAVTGVSARISFTNNLINSADLQQGDNSDPLLTGTTGRLWLSSSGELRLELQGDNGDAQVVINNRKFWVYDPSMNTVYEGSLPAGGADKSGKQKSGAEQIPSVAQIQSGLNRLAAHLDISGAIPGDIAGQAAYTVRVSPKHDGGLLGNVQLAWDAVRGVPLRFSIYARNDSTPVLELTATDISFGPVSSSDFAVSPPAGAKVVEISTPAATTASTHQAKGKKHAQVLGAAAVARHVSFKLVAPSKLVGLPRQSTSLLEGSASHGALVTYGQGLGGIAVIEQSSSAAPARIQSAGSQQSGGLSLPTVSINGATGQELDTALGTMIRFARGGVTYTLIGSVPPAAAEAAARAL